MEINPTKGRGGNWAQEVGWGGGAKWDPYENSFKQQKSAA